MALTLPTLAATAIRAQSIARWVSFSGREQMMGPTAPLPPGATNAYDWLWGYLIPIGCLMLVWSGLAPRRARRLTPVAASAVALAVLGYWAVGFALHMGGAFPVTEDPSLESLNAMLSVVPGDSGWGVMGLSGFFLPNESVTSAVTQHFLAYLPLVATAVVMVTVALAHLRRWVTVLAGALMATVILPVAACWAWGSGWLSHLGATLGLGSGYVDFGGTTLVLWLPGMVVLPILLFQQRQSEAAREPAPPPTYAPLIANMGGLLMGIGWIGWSLSRPFHVASASIDWHRTAMNILLGMSGAVLTSQLYGWLTTGKPETRLASLGLAAGWGALLGIAPFVPAWGALVVGLLSGLLFPLLHFLMNRRMRSHNGATAAAVALTSGILGTLGLGFLADGRWGQGWNGMGTGLSPEGGVIGPGVAGLFVTGNAQQLSAQAVGLLALTAWGLLWGAAIGTVARAQSIRLRTPRVIMQASDELAGPLSEEAAADGILSEALDTPPVPTLAEKAGVVDPTTKET